MTFLQLDTIRFIQVYVAQGSMFFMFLFLSYICFRKNRKHPFIYFSLFFLSIATGMFINFIFAPAKDEKIISVLNFLTIFFIVFSLVFLTVFCLSVYKQNKFGTFKQITIIVIHGTLIVFSILIPNGVEISEANNWIPRWNLFYFFYIIALTLVLGLVPTLYYSLRIYSTLNDYELKKRWKYFILSILLYYIAMYGTFLSNYLNISIFRIIIAITTVTLISGGHYLIYSGVIKKL